MGITSDSHRLAAVRGCRPVAFVIAASFFRPLAVWTFDNEHDQLVYFPKMDDLLCEHRRRTAGTARDVCEASN